MNELALLRRRQKQAEREYTAKQKAILCPRCRAEGPHIYLAGKALRCQACHVEWNIHDLEKPERAN